MEPEPPIDRQSDSLFAATFSLRAFVQEPLRSGTAGQPPGVHPGKQADEPSVMASRSHVGVNVAFTALARPVHVVGRPMFLPVSPRQALLLSQMESTVAKS